MSSKTGAKSKDEYIFSFYDQLERDNESSDIIYSEHQRLNNKDKAKDFVNDVYGTVYLDKVSPIPEKCEGIECFSDFVDLDILEQALSAYNLTLPKYIVFVEPNLLGSIMGASAWTPSFSSDKIYIHVELYEYKDEIPVVEAIAHEAWHLEKQPIFIRTITGFGYENKAKSVGESVSELYIRMKEVKTALDLSSNWK